MKRSLLAKLLLPLGILVVLFVVSLSVTFFVTSGQERDGAVINLAGRQRMLSQKMAKEAYLYLLTSDASILAELDRSVTAFDRTLKALAEGGDAPLDVKGTSLVALPVPSPEAAVALGAVRSLWNPFRDILGSLRDTASSGSGKDALEAIRRAEPEILRTMDGAVSVFQTEAEAKVVLLERSQELALVIAVAVALLCVFFYLRAILAPTRNMLLLMEDFAGSGGDLTRRLPVRTDDEIGRLGGAFNVFAEFIRSAFWRFSKGVQHFLATFYSVNSSLDAFSEEFGEVRERTVVGAGAVQKITGAVQQQYASSEEIASTAQSLARIAEELNGVVSEVAREAENGEAALDATIVTLTSVRENVSGVAEHAASLAEQAKVINSVVQAITGIAEQTNLLALNAAIEAARAGEAGRGFAVVAEEVRTLAEESKKAAARIGENLSTLMKGVSGTSGDIQGMAREMERVGTQISEVVHSISAILRRMAGVNEASQSVAAGAEELSASSQEMASGAESVSRFALELGAVIGSVEKSVLRLGDSVVLLRKQIADGAETGRSVLDALSHFSITTCEEFTEVCRIAIDGHAAWMRRLDDYIRGGLWNLETDPTRCRFGIFLAVTDTPPAVSAEWGEIRRLHDELHHLGHAVRDAGRSGRTEQMEELHRKARFVSEALTRKLEEVIRRCGEKSAGAAPLAALPSKR